MTAMKCAIESINNGHNQEQKFCEIGDRWFEITQSKENREKNEKNDDNQCDLWISMKRNTLHFGVAGEKEIEKKNAYLKKW